MGGHARSREIVEGRGRSYEVMGGHGRSWEIIRRGHVRSWEVMGGCGSSHLVVGVDVHLKEHLFDVLCGDLRVLSHRLLELRERDRAARGGGREGREGGEGGGGRQIKGDRGISKELR